MDTIDNLPWQGGWWRRARDRRTRAMRAVWASLPEWNAES